MRTRLYRPVFIGIAIMLATPLWAQDTPDMLGKALNLVRQVEASSDHPLTDAQKMDLLTQAIAAAQQAPNHHLQGHRVLAIQAVRSAITEIGKADPSHQVSTYLHTADQELSTSISLAGGTPPAATGSSTTAVPAPQTADDYFKLGWAKMHQSDWKGAVADFDQALKLDPAKVDAYLERGASKLMLGDRDGGMADYNQAAKIDRNNTATLLKLADALQMKDPKAAIAYYNQVIALDPKNEEAYKGIADVHWIHQEYDETIAAYDRLIAVDPKDWYAYGVRAMAKSAKGDLDGALADYGQDILLEPTDFNAFHNRADLKLKKGDLAGAAADLNQAISLGMRDAYVYRERADLRKTLGDLDGALADYNQVVTLDTNKADAFVNMDDVYASRGDIKFAKRDFEGALADYQQSITLNKQNKDVDYFCIWAAQNLQGKKTDADAQLSSEMANSLGDDWNWHANIANFLLGQIDETALMKAATLPDAGKTGLCQAWYYAGMKQLLAGNKSAAADDFKKCLTTDPKDERATFFAQVELKALAQ
jgi:tetratricopeptide (TPR) repeat protein